MGMVGEKLILVLNKTFISVEVKIQDHTDLPLPWNLNHVTNCLAQQLINTMICGYTYCLCY